MTLIELMIVILILGVLSAIEWSWGVSSFQNTGDSGVLQDHFAGAPRGRRRPRATPRLTATTPTGGLTT